MAFDGNGTFNRIFNWGTDKLNGIFIRADRMDQEMDGMATGLSTCITKDGQTNPTANLPMNDKKHTGVAAGTARKEYADVASSQDGTYVYAADTAADDSYLIALSPAITTYVEGQTFTFKATTANTGACTLNVNSVGAIAIKKDVASDLADGDIQAGQTVTVVYDGTNFQLVSISGNAAGLKDTNTFSGDNSFQGKFSFPNGGELTIASGAITPTGAYHFVDTEGDASSDDLATISGGQDGQVLILQPENSVRVVTLVASGNIDLPEGNPVTLRDDKDSVTLLFNATLSKWVLVAKSIDEGGSRVLLQKQTVSNVAEVDFTAGFSSDFASYELKFEQAEATGTSYYYLRFSTDGGATFETTGYASTITLPDISSVDFGTSSLMRLTHNSSNPVSTFGVSGNVKISRMIGQDLTGLSYVQVQSLLGERDLLHYAGGRVGQANTEYNGIRVKNSAGNIVRGTFYLYGIKE